MKAKDKGSIGLILAIIVLIVFLVALSWSKKQMVSVPGGQNANVSSVDSDLNDLNSTDIDNGIDQLLTQNDSDASNF